MRRASERSACPPRTVAPNSIHTFTRPPSTSRTPIPRCPPLPLPRRVPQAAPFPALAHPGRAVPARARRSDDRQRRTLTEKGGSRWAAYMVLTGAAGSCVRRDRPPTTGTIFSDFTRCPPPSRTGRTPLRRRRDRCPGRARGRRLERLRSEAHRHRDDDLRRRARRR